MANNIGLLTTDDLRSPMSEVRSPSSKCRATGERPAVPAPSGSEGGGGGICAMRGRATARLCVVIRGVVPDAVPCLFNGVICDLPFNVVGSPIEDYQHNSTSLLDLSIPGGVLRNHSSSSGRAHTRIPPQQNNVVTTSANHSSSSGCTHTGIKPQVGEVWPCRSGENVEGMGMLSIPGGLSQSGWL